MNTLQRLLSNTFLAFASSVLVKAGNALLFILIGRQLGPAASGSFSLATTYFTFVFGLSAHGVAAERAAGYQPLHLYEGHPRVKAVLDAIAGGQFSPDEPARHRGLVDSLLWGGDHYMLLADFDSYLAAQERVDTLYRDRDAWAAKAIANVAGMGYFSSDRTIGEYAREVWGLQPPG